MATKTTRTSRTRKTKTSRARSAETNWEDFRPEWAIETIDRISGELEKWTDEFQSRRAQFRKESQQRIEDGLEQLQEELRKLPGMKRAEKLRDDLERRVEQSTREGMDAVYTRLKIARLDEVKRLERKIAQLNRKLRELEKRRAA